MADLRRSMSLSHATSLVVGIILGASIFVQPSEITHLIPNARKMVVVWVIAGALTLCGALVCAELAAAFPETGGVYVFLKRIFSPALGFLWGWGMFWSVHSGIIAAIAVVMARYATYFIPMGERGIRVTAMAAILLLSGLNYVGIRAGSLLQVILTVTKVAAILLLVSLLFLFGGAAHRSLSPAADNYAQYSWQVYGLAIAAGLFSFGGWHMVTYAAGETREPARTIPLALILGTLIVCVCYIALNSGYLRVMNVAEIAKSNHAAADAIERAVGSRSSAAVAALVVISAFGSLNGIILAGPRVYYAMAEDGLAFRWLGAVDRRRKTPHLAILAQAVWSCVLVATNSYRQLFTRVVYSEWIFFALLAVGFFVLRQRGELRPHYLRGPLLILPALFIIASLGIVWSQVSADPHGSALGIGLLLIGLPVYFIWSRQMPKEEHARAGD
jgi:basic amino acid/polyamine antiporter, APA family